MNQSEMDIVSLPTEIDRQKLDSRYRLIVMAAQHARVLAQGVVKPKSDTKATKPTTIAIQEALAGNLEYLIGDEARVASEQARLLEVRRAQEEAKRREEMGVELSELEKDLKIYLHEKEVEDRPDLDALFSEQAESESVPEADEETEVPAPEEE